jgi:hypothetical protein
MLFASLTQDAIVANVNPVREGEGVAPLHPDPLLAEAAQRKAEDMFARQYFAHIGPEGELPWVWLERVGYHYAAAGENLAIDFSDPNAVVNAWLNSPTHAANIRNNLFTDIGVGIANGTFEGRETTIVVMFLGRKLSQATAATIVPSSPSPQPQPPSPLKQETSATNPPPSGKGGVSPLPTPLPPTQEPTPTVTPSPTPTALTEKKVLEPIVEERVPLRVGEFTATKEARGSSAPHTLPLPDRLVTFGFVLASLASAIRLAFTIVCGLILLGSATLFLLPSHRKEHHFFSSGYLALLLTILWAPTLFR